MKTELEKCMAGEWYDCHDPVFIEGKARASAWCAKYVSINLNCTFIDCNRITIGNDVLIAPCVHLSTSGHPVELVDRLTPDWNPESGAYRWRTFAKPITIGNGCWIGANVVVLPGVTIGDGAVIGAGSVVTKDIPANVVAVGNPCRVIRAINKGETI